LFDEFTPPLKTKATIGPVPSRTVLDTSVLIADPSCLTQFRGTDVVIPLTVIEELDGLKGRPDDVGRAARAALRSIEDIRLRVGGSLAVPVPLRDDGSTDTLCIEINGVHVDALEAVGLDSRKADNRIIGAAIGQSEFADTTVVSNDAALRIKAAHLGLRAVEHHPVGRSVDTRHAGWITVEVNAGVIDSLYNGDVVDVEDVVFGQAVFDNEFVVVRAGSQSALTQVRNGTLSTLHGNAPEPWGLHSRSKEQRFALELLMDPRISVVSLDGRAGTGKTLLAIAAGLEHVVERKQHERLSVYRPLVPVGRAEIGFLPGGLDEKLDPWMAAIYDAIVALTDRSSQQDAQSLIDELNDRDQLSLESVTFLRGRSLHRQFVVIDEAQNLEPTTLKTILTRVGEGTKIVFTGDTSQIDAPYLGESNNALAVLIQAFRGQRCFGHVTLNTCERGEVASLAAELL